MGLDRLEQASQGQFLGSGSHDVASHQALDFPSLLDSQVRLLGAELRRVRAQADRRAAFAALGACLGGAFAGLAGAASSSGGVLQAASVRRRRAVMTRMEVYLVEVERAHLDTSQPGSQWSVQAQNQIACSGKIMVCVSGLWQRRGYGFGEVGGSGLDQGRQAS